MLSDIGYYTSVWYRIYENSSYIIDYNQHCKSYWYIFFLLFFSRQQLPLLLLICSLNLIFKFGHCLLHWKWLKMAIVCCIYTYASIEIMLSSSSYIDTTFALLKTFPWRSATFVCYNKYLVYGFILHSSLSFLGPGYKTYEIVKESALIVSHNI